MKEDHTKFDFSISSETEKTKALVMVAEKSSLTSVWPSLQ